MKYALLILLVAVSAFAGAMEIYVDCQPHKFDLVFVIDTSGSMAGLEDDLVWSTHAADSILEFCDVRWGLVTYSDSVGGDHDFDPSNPGIDLTDDYHEFRAEILTDYSGGGDSPSEDLDALWVAINRINWRSDARHFIFILTNSVFCEITDVCPRCNSNLSKEECLDSLISHDIILCPIVNTTLHSSTCVPLPPYHLDFWNHSAETTGGVRWDLDGSWRVDFYYLTRDLSNLPNGYISIKNNLASGTNLTVSIETFGYISVDSIEYSPRVLEPYGIDTLSLRAGRWWTIATPAFHVIGDFDGGAHVETLLVTLDSCGCHEAVVEFERGWNAVSLPSDYATVPLSRFETAIGDAFLYDAVVGDYEATDLLAPGMGYWILSGESDRVMFAGQPIDGIWMPTFRGWNLLGGGSLPF